VIYIDRSSRLEASAGVLEESERKEGNAVIGKVVWWRDRQTLYSRPWQGRRTRELRYDIRQESQNKQNNERWRHGMDLGDLKR